MDSLTRDPAPPAISLGPLSAFFRREPLFAGTALCLVILMLPILAAMAFDDRTLLGINVWVKPFKFAVSLAVFTATLAWFAAWLPAGVTRQVWYRLFTAAAVFCIAAEMVWIAGAAANGVASHFNRTPPMDTIYGLMGVFAVFLTSTSLLYCVLIWRNRQSTLDPVFRLSVVLGLVLTFVLTVAVAGHMASTLSHHVGTAVSDAGGVPLVGWSRDGGDLRVAHFFATHALQALPAFGLVAALITKKPAGKAVVLLFAAGYVGIVAFTFVQALDARPFVAWYGAGSFRS